MLRLGLVCWSAGFLSVCSAAHASYTTVDLDGVVDANLALGEPAFPTGTTTGNTGTGIPFALSGLNGETGAWIANPWGVETVDVKLDLTGQSSVYALLNNYFGHSGADEYDVTVKATDGDSVTYQSIGGVDTRDYNAAVFTNTVGGTTTPWFSNGLGQRLDVRAFVLPASFLDETISDFIVTQVKWGDSALLTGLTFGASAVPIPEPKTWPLLAIGLLSLTIVRRRSA